MGIFLSIGMMFVFFVFFIYFLHYYMKETNRKMTWWKWAMSISWMILVLLASATIGTFAGEGAPQAILPGGGFFLVLIVISGLAIFRILFAKDKAKEVDA